jgi:hypothetical protein
VRIEFRNLSEVRKQNRHPGPPQRSLLYPPPKTSSWDPYWITLRECEYMDYTYTALIKIEAKLESAQPVVKFPVYCLPEASKNKSS